MHAATTSIQFHGTRGGPSPLTWGQRDVYRAFLHHSPHAAFFNLHISLPVPRGTGLGRVCGALRWAIEAYESLRTTYATDAAGRPYQLVHREGSVLLHVVEAARSEFRADAPLEHLGREFEHWTELPVRCVLVTKDGDPAVVTLEVSHLAADTVGGRILRHALTRWLGTDARQSVRPTYHPVDRAADEATPDWSAVSGRATAYLHRTFETHSVPMFTQSEPGGLEALARPRTCMTSPALGAAVGLLSHRHRLTTSAIYMAIMAILVAVLSGRSACVFAAVSSNRWMPGADGYVGTLNQYAVVAVDLAGADLPTALRRVQAASLQAFGNALYDIHEVAANDVLTALDQVDCVINDNQLPSGPVSEVSFDTVATLRAQTTIKSLAPLRATPPPFRRSIQLSVGGTKQQPQLSLCMDRRAFPMTDLGGVLRAVETVTLAAAEPSRAADGDPLSLMARALTERTTVGAQGPGSNPDEGLPW